MPQMGQCPGPSRTISGCIGQVYSTFAAAAAAIGAAAAGFGAMGTPTFASPAAAALG